MEGGRGKRKRSALPQQAMRVHKRIIGILTTGHTWQVYRFSVVDRALEDLEAKPLMELIGRFSMPVLADRSNEGGSGVTSTRSLTTLDVARVMAVLVLAAQGEL